MYDIGFGHKILFFLREVDNLVQGRLQMPVSFEIDASNYCQNDCDFCMFAFHIKKHRTHLPLLKFWSLLWAFKRLNVRSITFTGGGEPMMNPDILEMIKAASEIDLKVGLVTNGIELDKISGFEQRLEYIRVSLDAASDETYYRTKHTRKFNRIIRNIKNVVDTRRTDVGVSFVITQDNKHEIEDFYDLANDLGVHYAQVKPELKPCDMLSQTKNVDGNKFFVTERYNIDKSSTLACQIAGLTGVINATGKVYYCCIHRGRKEFEIGDVYEDSLFDIYSRKRPEFKPNLALCGSSCRYMNYVQVYNKVKDKRFIPLRHRRFI